MNNIDNFFTKDAATFSRSYIEYLHAVLDRLDLQEIASFIETLLDARKKGATVFFIGNGGSASTASHFANDLAIGTNDYEQPFRVISLADNISVLTALGNDYGYEEIFERQLRVYGKSDDVLVAISASGNSPNLLKAFEFAQTAGIKTVAITAFDGGKLKLMADQGIHVPTELKEYGPAEDVHMILDHLVGAYLARYVKHA
jgi:D-sedoheptulose 7-phosphate isomerase